jgi:hypothetical protein
LDNINNNLFISEELISISPENSDVEQSINSRPKNILSLLIKDKTNNIIFFFN